MNPTLPKLSLMALAAATALLATPAHAGKDLDAIKKRGEDLVFLRKIIPGGADRSYGIEVAKLAGLPKEVVSRAKKILEELEAGGSYIPPREEREQVSLDAIGEAEVLDALRRAQPDTMSPIEAMQLLYDLKKKLPN